LLAINFSQVVSAAVTYAMQHPVATVSFAVNAGVLFKRAAKGAIDFDRVLLNYRYERKGLVKKLKSASSRKPHRRRSRLRLLIRVVLRFLAGRRKAAEA
jgi:hypothetical protein